jgi:selenocysteine lyase/cysteine desulfurase
LGSSLRGISTQRGLLVDYRPSIGIRIAPHFYNSDAECEAVIREIASLRDKAVQPLRRRGLSSLANSRP